MKKTELKLIILFDLPLSLTFMSPKPKTYADCVEFKGMSNFS